MFRTAAHNDKQQAAGGIFGGIARMFQGGASAADDGGRAATAQRPAQPPGQPELPPYTVVRRSGSYTLRLYDVYPVVCMDYARREEGYAALGSYFDGGNVDGVRFAYTQPVVMRYNPDGSKNMQMHVGSRQGGAAPGGTPSAGQALANLPAPMDPAVQLSVSGGELVAALQFDGFITPQSAAAARAKLISALKQDGIELAEEESEGLFRVGQYGAVYSLPGARLNELLLRVKA